MGVAQGSHRGTKFNFDRIWSCIYQIDDIDETIALVVRIWSLCHPRWPPKGHHCMVDLTNLLIFVQIICPVWSVSAVYFMWAIQAHLGLLLFLSALLVSCSCSGVIEMNRSVSRWVFVLSIPGTEFGGYFVLRRTFVYMYCQLSHTVLINRYAYMYIYPRLRLGWI